MIKKVIANGNAGTVIYGSSRMSVEKGEFPVGEG